MATQRKNGAPARLKPAAEVLPLAAAMRYPTMPSKIQSTRTATARLPTPIGSMSPPCDSCWDIMILLAAVNATAPLSPLVSFLVGVIRRDRVERLGRR